MKSIIKIIWSVSALASISTISLAQQITQPKGFSSLTPAHRSKLENILNSGGLDIRHDTLKYSVPRAKSRIKTDNNRVPGLEKMPFYNPGPLSKWKMPNVPIDSTIHYQIQKKPMPGDKKSEPLLKYKDKKAPPDTNPGLKQ